MCREYELPDINHDCVEMLSADKDPYYIYSNDSSRIIRWKRHNSDMINLFAGNLFTIPNDYLYLANHKTNQIELNIS